MKKVASLIIVYLFAICLSVKGQVETKIFPKEKKSDTARILNLKKSSKIYRLPTFDATKMLAEDREVEGCDVPFRFGKGFDVNLSLKDGTWEETEYGKVWSLNFEAKSAYSLNFVFENFHLATGAELYIVNQDENIIYGPVTSDAISKNGFFLTDVIPDSQVTIYLYEPTKADDKSSITIRRVVYGYRKVFVDMNGGLVGLSSPCNNDIVCFPEYAEEAKAVALVLLADGTEWCSGSLLMTTESSLKPYFLTAFHCIDTRPKYAYTQGNGIISADEITDAEKWMFKFNHMKTSCNGSSIKTSYTYNSSTFRAAWYNTDFALMEINHNLSQYEGRHSWLGWDRSESVPISGTGIHHPAGDVMKISIENDSFLSSSWNNSGTLNHWLVNYDDGIVEGGSSGSPILNSDNKVVGQLHGGPKFSNLCNQKTAYYGKFNLSWTGDGTNSTRLSNWLDPINSGVIHTNSSFSSQLSAPPAVCTTATAQIENFPMGCTINWSVNDNCVQITSGQGTETVTLQRNYDGMATLTATISCNGTVVKTLSQDIMVGNPAFCMSITPVAANGGWGYWRSDMSGNTISIEYLDGVNYPSYVVDLYKINNNFTLGSHVGHWETTSLSNMTFNGYSEGWYSLQIAGVNDCGTSYTVSTEFECRSGSGGGLSPLFSFSYNQDSEMLTVTLNPVLESSQEQTTDGCEIQLWNEGSLLRKCTTKDERLQIPMSGMKGGLYIIRAVTDDSKSQQQKFIKR